jgi:hypothetical protein
MNDIHEVILAVENESKFTSKHILLYITCILASIFSLSGLFISVLSYLFTTGMHVGENILLVKPLVFYTFGGKTFIILNILFFITSLIAIFLLWKKSHKGLWLFILAQLMLTFAPFYFLHWGFLPLLSNLYPIISISFVLMILFAVNFKKLY